MNENRILLFDLGRVIFDFDHRIAIRKIASCCHVDEAKLYDLFFDSELIHRYECGFISSRDFFNQAKKLGAIKLSFKEFAPAWNEIFTPKPDMLQLLEILAERYPLYMASNISELHSHYLQHNFPEYFRPFKKCFLSCEMGLRKPDPAFYTLIIKELKRQASDIIYTDDRVELVSAALALGIDAVVFSSAEQFKEQLRQRHIMDFLCVPQP